MKENKWLNLQLFGDGGDGGDAHEGSEGGEVSGEQIPAFIPEKAKKTYRKAMEKTRPQGDTRGQTTATQNAEETQHVSYADLIKSDEYKEEHKAYMDKTIGDRLKKYKGLEERQARYDDVLSLIASKYGIDATSENFLEDVKSKVSEDDSTYERYAMEHDISIDEAKRVMDLEQKVQRAEAAKRQQEQMAVQMEQDRVNRERWDRLLKSADETKRRYPDFNFEAEMQNERFRNMCAVNHEDTTAAYVACHWNDIMNRTVANASMEASKQTANAIASGRNRPIESGLSSNASAVVETDFSKMNLQQLRAYAEQQRLKGR